MIGQHIEVDIHFIKKKIDSSQIFIPFVSSKQQLADVLTKRLPKYTFHSYIGKLGLTDIYKLIYWEVGIDRYLLTSLKGSVEEQAVNRY